jgi:peptidyl-prolyl cis-trans isomerase-like 3
MANSGPDTNKSQFFIAYAKQAHLDSKYTIFGKVIDGHESTLDAMERVPVNNKNRPLTEIKLSHVRRTLLTPPILGGIHPTGQQVTIHSNPIADAQLRS